MLKDINTDVASVNFVLPLVVGLDSKITTAVLNLRSPTSVRGYRVGNKNIKHIHIKKDCSPTYRL